MNRFKQIDILRALAVLLVMGRHLTPCPAEASHLLHQATRVWFQGGWVGVDLFFVLSGFLVSGLLFREYEKHRELHIGNFLIRRGFKIYPPFWVLILVTVMVAVPSHQELPRHAVVSELLFLQNYGPSLWNHTWSLAVEEHFYLLLAAGLFCLAKYRAVQPFAAVPMAFVCVAVLCLVLRVHLAGHDLYRHKTHLLPTHLRLDSLFFGVLLSYFFHRYPIRFMSVASRFRYLLFAVGILLLLPAFCFPLETTPFISTYGFSLFYLGSGCLLAAALGGGTPGSRIASAMAYIGSHSYSIYLWHMPVAIGGAGFIAGALGQRDNWFVYAGIYLAGAVLFGIAMALLVEFPVLRIRDRFYPSRGRPLSTDAVQLPS